MNTTKSKIEALAVKKWIQAEGIDLVRIADAHNLILAYPPRLATAHAICPERHRYGRRPFSRRRVFTRHHALDAEQNADIPLVG